MKSTLLRPFRDSIERVPLLAESYRLVRDYVKFRRSTPKPTPLGFKLTGNRKMESGAFEPVETQLIKGELERAEVFVDVGANVGYYTCLARSLGRQVVAIEPSTATLRLLFANLVANEMRDVEVFPVGLSDKAEVAVLYGGGGNASLLLGWSTSTKVYSEVIPTTTLDRLLEARFAGQRLFIKIDIEGLEYRCLLGATHTLSRDVAPTWFLEIYLDQGHREGLNPNFLATFELFWNHGYEAREAVPAGRIIDRDTVKRWIDAGRVDSPSANYVFAKR
ncbi:MAG: FkbM family methyltransferase [Myxococcota bacterium]|nr:FkbM family methyltransferase [Myxococcota bacterium]